MKFEVADNYERKRIKTYSEFWDFYVLEHSKPATRYLHFVGRSLGIVMLVWFLRLARIFIFRFVLLSAMRSPGFRIFRSKE